MDETTFQVLEEELKNCQELLELEPDSKWALYTKVLIMKTMDPEKYHDEIVKGFDSLCQIDPTRQGYYRDQRSKSIIQRVLCNNGDDHVDLSNHELTSVSYFKELFAFSHKINLSNNQLKSVDTLLPYLINCQVLILDNNEIQKMEQTLLKHSLATLSLKSNPLSADFSK